MGSSWQEYWSGLLCFLPGDLPNQESSLHFYCRSSFYCSKEHQRQDWKKHKLVCQVGENVPAPGTGEQQQPGPAPPPRATGAREARKAAPRRLKNQRVPEKHLLLLY